MELRIYQDKQEVAEYFSDYLYDLAQTRDSLHIALSGGSTPKVIFRHLVSAYGDSMPWEKFHFYWGDERCVPPDDKESNYKMTVDYLLSGIPVLPENVHRVRGEADPKEEAERYGALLEDTLSKVNGVPQFDLVILGMGDDGHTASIFPYNIELWDSPNVCEVAAHPDSGQLRVTLTGKVINAALEVAFLVTGASKADKVHEIINGVGDFEKYPASLVDPLSGHLLWFLDAEAAQKLTSA